MAKILVYGNPASPLVRSRGLIGQEGKHQIFWVSFVKANLPEVTAFGFPAYFSRFRLLKAILEPFLVIWALWLARPDIIHVHYASKGLGAIPLLGKTPLIVSVMGSDILPQAGYKGIFAPFTRLLLNRAVLITSKSTYMDRALRAIGDYENKIERVVWGIDTELFKPGKPVEHWQKKLNIPKGKIVFFEPRNAKPLYNKHIVIEAFSKYQKMGGLPAHLLLAIGSSDRHYLNRIKNQINRLNLGNTVHLLDPLSAGEMAEMFCLADVTISVPQSDGLPQSFFEALACESFLLLGDLPQYGDIVKHCAGVETVEVGNADLLAKKMVSIASRSAMRTKARGANRNYVKLHADRRNQTELMLRIYTRILGKSDSV